MIRRRQLDRAYRSLVHAFYYIGPDERETSGILESARRELYRAKLEFTKYPLYGHHCHKCPRYDRRHNT
jgi:hypothetical protein